MRKYLIAVLMLVSFPAFGQRSMTTVELTAALTAAVEQGNYARAMHIQSEAKAAGLADELAKAQARIKELETKPAEPKN